MRSQNNMKNMELGPLILEWYLTRSAHPITSFHLGLMKVMAATWFNSASTSFEEIRTLALISHSLQRMGVSLQRILCVWKKLKWISIPWFQEHGQIEGSVLLLGNQDTKPKIETIGELWTKYSVGSPCDRN